jgi:predicted lipid-binding transport protein (Tim44 family)
MPPDWKHQVMQTRVVGIVALVTAAVSRAARRWRAYARPSAYPALGDETVAAPPPSQRVGLDARPAAGAAPGVPPGFDVGGFLRAAKLSFMKLQAASDTGDLAELQELTTPEAYAALEQGLRARLAGAPQTDVLLLHAHLLEFVFGTERHCASVRFCGQLREAARVAPEGFEEIWNLCKPVEGPGGWRLAGIQQMH